MGGSGSLGELPMGVALPPMGRLSRGPEGPPSVLPQAPVENRTPRCADSGWLDSAGARAAGVQVVLRVEGRS